MGGGGGGDLRGLSVFFGLRAFRRASMGAFLAMAFVTLAGQSDRERD